MKKKMSAKSTAKMKIGVLLGVLVLGCAWAARKPDLNLYFTRNIPTTLSPERLENNVSSVARWSQWFFSLAKVTIVDSPSLKSAALKQAKTGVGVFHDPSLIEKGAILKFQMNSHRFLSNPFELTAEVTEYQPFRTLRLTLLDDSSGKLTQLFDRIEWRLEFEAKDGGTLIHAVELTHTRSWKARLFGRLAERILMNQVFYLDIIKLSELKQPFTIDEGPKTKGGFGTASD